MRRTSSIIAAVSFIAVLVLCPLTLGKTSTHNTPVQLPFTLLEALGKAFTVERSINGTLNVVEGATYAPTAAFDGEDWWFLDKLLSLTDADLELLGIPREILLSNKDERSEHKRRQIELIKCQIEKTQSYTDDKTTCADYKKPEDLEERSKILALETKKQILDSLLGSRNTTCLELDDLNRKNSNNRNIWDKFYYETNLLQRRWRDLIYQGEMIYADCEDTPGAIATIVGLYRAAVTHVKENGTNELMEERSKYILPSAATVFGKTINIEWQDEKLDDSVVFTPLAERVIDILWKDNAIQVSYDVRKRGRLSRLLSYEEDKRIKRSTRRNQISKDPACDSNTVKMSSIDQTIPGGVRLYDTVVCRSQAYSTSFICTLKHDGRLSIIDEAETRNFLLNQLDTAGLEDLGLRHIYVERSKNDLSTRDELIFYGNFRNGIQPAEELQRDINLRREVDLISYYIHSSLAHAVQNHAIKLINHDKSGEKDDWFILKAQSEINPFETRNYKQQLLAIGRRVDDNTLAVLGLELRNGELSIAHTSGLPRVSLLYQLYEAQAIDNYVALQEWDVVASEAVAIHYLSMRNGYQQELFEKVIKREPDISEGPCGVVDYAIFHPIVSEQQVCDRIENSSHPAYVMDKAIYAAKAYQRIHKLRGEVAKAMLGVSEKVELVAMKESSLEEAYEIENAFSTQSSDLYKRQYSEAVIAALVNGAAIRERTADVINSIRLGGPAAVGDVKSSMNPVYARDVWWLERFFRKPDVSRQLRSILEVESAHDVALGYGGDTKTAATAIGEQGDVPGNSKRGSDYIDDDLISAESDKSNRVSMCYNSSLPSIIDASVGHVQESKAYASVFCSGSEAIKAVLFQEASKKNASEEIPSLNKLANVSPLLSEAIGRPYLIHEAIISTQKWPAYFRQSKRIANYLTHLANAMEITLTLRDISETVLKQRSNPWGKVADSDLLELIDTLFCAPSDTSSSRCRENAGTDRSGPRTIDVGSGIYVQVFGLSNDRLICPTDTSYDEVSSNLSRLCLRRQAQRIVENGFRPQQSVENDTPETKVPAENTWYATESDSNTVSNCVQSAEQAKRLGQAMSDLAIIQAEDNHFWSIEHGDIGGCEELTRLIDASESRRAKLVELIMGAKNGDDDTPETNLLSLPFFLDDIYEKQNTETKRELLERIYVSTGIPIEDYLKGWHLDRTLIYECAHFVLTELESEIGKEVSEQEIASNFEQCSALTKLRDVSQSWKRYLAENYKNTPLADFVDKHADSSFLSSFHDAMNQRYLFSLVTSPDWQFFKNYRPLPIRTLEYEDILVLQNMSRECANDGAPVDAPSFRNCYGLLGIFDKNTDASRISYGDYVRSVIEARIHTHLKQIASDSRDRATKFGAGMRVEIVDAKTNSGAEESGVEDQVLIQQFFEMGLQPVIVYKGSRIVSARLLSLAGDPKLDAFDLINCRNSVIKQACNWAGNIWNADITKLLSDITQAIDEETEANSARKIGDIRSAKKLDELRFNTLTDQLINANCRRDECTVDIPDNADSCDSPAIAANKLRRKFALPKNALLYDHWLHEARVHFGCDNVNGTISDPNCSVLQKKEPELASWIERKAMSNHAAKHSVDKRGWKSWSQGDPADHFESFESVNIDYKDSIDGSVVYCRDEGEIHVAYCNGNTIGKSLPGFRERVCDVKPINLIGLNGQHINSVKYSLSDFISGREIDYANECLAYQKTKIAERVARTDLAKTGDSSEHGKSDAGSNDGIVAAIQRLFHDSLMLKYGASDGRIQARLASDSETCSLEDASDSAAIEQDLHQASCFDRFMDRLPDVLQRSYSAGGAYDCEIRNSHADAAIFEARCEYPNGSGRSINFSLDELFLDSATDDTAQKDLQSVSDLIDRKLAYSSTQIDTTDSLERRSDHAIDLSRNADDVLMATLSSFRTPTSIFTIEFCDTTRCRLSISPDYHTDLDITDLGDPTEVARAVEKLLLHETQTYQDSINSLLDILAPNYELRAACSRTTVCGLYLTAGSTVYSPPAFHHGSDGRPVLNSNSLRKILNESNSMIQTSPWLTFDVITTAVDGTGLRVNLTLTQLGETVAKTVTLFEASGSDFKFHGEWLRDAYDVFGAGLCLNITRELRTIGLPPEYQIETCEALPQITFRSPSEPESLTLDVTNLETAQRSLLHSPILNNVLSNSKEILEKWFMSMQVPVKLELTSSSALRICMESLSCFDISPNAQKDDLLEAVTVKISELAVREINGVFASVGVGAFSLEMVGGEAGGYTVVVGMTESPRMVIDAQEMLADPAKYFIYQPAIRHYLEKALGEALARYVSQVQIRPESDELVLTLIGDNPQAVVLPVLPVSGLTSAIVQAISAGSKDALCDLTKEYLNTVGANLGRFFKQAPAMENCAEKDWTLVYQIANQSSVDRIEIGNAQDALSKIQVELTAAMVATVGDELQERLSQYFKGDNGTPTDLELAVTLAEDRKTLQYSYRGDTVFSHVVETPQDLLNAQTQALNAYARFFGQKYTVLAESSIVEIIDRYTQEISPDFRFFCESRAHCRLSYEDTVVDAGTLAFLENQYRQSNANLNRHLRETIASALVGHLSSKLGHLATFDFIDGKVNVAINAEFIDGLDTACDPIAVDPGIPNLGEHIVKDLMKACGSALAEAKSQFQYTAVKTALHQINRGIEVVKRRSNTSIVDFAMAETLGRANESRRIFYSCDFVSRGTLPKCDQLDKLIETVVTAFYRVELSERMADTVQRGMTQICTDHSYVLKEFPFPIELRCTPNGEMEARFDFLGESVKATSGLNVDLNQNPPKITASIERLTTIPSIENVIRNKLTSAYPGLSLGKVSLEANGVRVTVSQYFDFIRKTIHGEVFVSPDKFQVELEELNDLAFSVACENVRDQVWANPSILQTQLADLSLPVQGTCLKDRFLQPLELTIDGGSFSGYKDIAIPGSLTIDKSGKHKLHFDTDLALDNLGKYVLTKLGVEEGANVLSTDTIAIIPPYFLIDNGKAQIPIMLTLKPDLFEGLGVKKLAVEIRLSADGVKFGQKLVVRTSFWVDAGYFAFGNFGMGLDPEKKLISLLGDMTWAPGESVKDIAYLAGEAEISLRKFDGIKLTGELFVAELGSLGSGNVCIGGNELCKVVREGVTESERLVAASIRAGIPDLPLLNLDGSLLLLFDSDPFLLEAKASGNLLGAEFAKASLVYKDPLNGQFNASAGIDNVVDVELQAGVTMGMLLTSAGFRFELANVAEVSGFASLSGRITAKVDPVILPGFEITAKNFPDLISQILALLTKLNLDLALSGGRDLLIKQDMPEGNGEEPDDKPDDDVAKESEASTYKSEFISERDAFVEWSSPEVDSNKLESGCFNGYEKNCTGVKLGVCISLRPNTNKPLLGSCGRKIGNKENATNPAALFFSDTRCEKPAGVVCPKNHLGVDHANINIYMFGEQVDESHTPVYRIGRYGAERRKRILFTKNARDIDLLKNGNKKIELYSADANPNPDSDQYSFGVFSLKNKSSPEVGYNFEYAILTPQKNSPDLYVFANESNYWGMVKANNQCPDQDIYCYGKGFNYGLIKGFIEGFQLKNPAKFVNAAATLDLPERRNMQAAITGLAEASLYKRTNMYVQKVWKAGDAYVFLSGYESGGQKESMISFAQNGKTYNYLVVGESSSILLFDEDIFSDGVGGHLSTTCSPQPEISLINTCGTVTVLGDRDKALLFLNALKGVQTSFAFVANDGKVLMGDWIATNNFKSLYADPKKLARAMAFSQTATNPKWQLYKNLSSHNPEPTLPAERALLILGWPGEGSPISAYSATTSRAHVTFKGACFRTGKPIQTTAPYQIWEERLAIPQTRRFDLFHRAAANDENTWFDAVDGALDDTWREIRADGAVRWKADPIGKYDPVKCEKLLAPN